jgi:hypothetical protein
MTAIISSDFTINILYFVDKNFGGVIGTDYFRGINYHININSMGFDFGYDSGETGDSVTTPVGDGNNGVTPIEGSKGINASDGNAVTDITANNPAGNEGNGGIGHQPEPIEGDGNNPEPDDNTPKPADGDMPYEIGTVLEADGVKYTIDDNGNAVDTKGNIFKRAEEVKEWVESFDGTTVGDGVEGAVNIETIQDAFGIEIVDENEVPIQFENSPEGVVGYVNALLETTKEETATATIEALYEKYPIVESVLNYYVANGNSLEGYGQIQDRTNITIDPKNELQQEEIIRMAWNEQGRKGDVNGYIQYIKSQDQLLDVARDELEGMQERDAEYFDQLAQEADRAEQASIEQQKAYWTAVKETVDNRSIAGFRLPETIVINRNGQKTAATPNDFFNYIYQVDKKGKSAYEHELSKETPQERMNNELLSAYIKFSGGDYTSLVNMAVHENNVKTIKLRSASKPAGTVKVTPTAKKVTKEIDLGF